MSILLQQRCRNHSNREAVLRCPECHYFYCRECGAEHDGRMLCAACIKKLTEISSTPTRPPRGWPAILWSLAGLILLWLAFYLCAKVLLAIPSQFHEGSYWRR